MEQQQVWRKVWCTLTHHISSLSPVKLTHTWLQIAFPPSVAPGDYGNLTNFRLDPFNNDLRELSFNVTIVNDNIPEDVEMLNVSLTLDPADQDRLGNRVTVSPDVATITIQDDDSKLIIKTIPNVC